METQVSIVFLHSFMNLFSRTFHGISFKSAKKVTRSTQFLEEMEQVILWDKFLKRVDKHYYKTENNLGRKNFASKLMLQIYFLQQWYNLSDPAIEDAIYDRLSFQKFLWIDIGKKGSVRDEATILNFRHLLEEHNLQERFFEIVKKIMEKEWLILNKWTSVDISLIKVPSSTKNNPLSQRQEKRNKQRTDVRKKVEFNLWVVKNLWWHSKVRYRWLEKTQSIFSDYLLWVICLNIIICLKRLLRSLLSGVYTQIMRIFPREIPEL